MSRRINTNDFEIGINRYALTSQLGPVGEKFVTVWTHGCCRNCPGCIAEGWNRTKEPRLTVSPDILAEMLLMEYGTLDGVVLSGGEPFLWSAALSEMIACLDESEEKRMGVMIYTGYSYDELKELAKDKDDVASLLARADIIVDGSYIKSLDNSEAFRGSSNQRLIFLTDRYNEGDIVRDAKRAVTLEINCDETSMSGIPSEADKNIWNSIIKSKL